MSYFDEIPNDNVERAEMMEGILTSRATGGAGDNGIYVQLRRDFMADPNTRDLLPKFVRTYRNLDAFWPFIKNEAPSYAERREIISRAFTIDLPLVRSERSQKSAKGVHLSDLATYLDKRREVALYERDAFK